MYVISVFNYLLAIIILWVGWVECRICKWELLSDLLIGLLLLPLRYLPRLGMWGLVFHILLQQTECASIFNSLIKIHGQDLSVPEFSVHLVS